MQQIKSIALRHQRSGLVMRQLVLARMSCSSRCSRRGSGVRLRAPVPIARCRRGTAYGLAARRWCGLGRVGAGGGERRANGRRQVVADAEHTEAVAVQELEMRQAPAQFVPKLEQPKPRSRTLVSYNSMMSAKDVASAVCNAANKAGDRLVRIARAACR